MSSVTLKGFTAYAETHDEAPPRDAETLGDVPPTDSLVGLGYGKPLSYAASLQRLVARADTTTPLSSAQPGHSCQDGGDSLGGAMPIDFMSDWPPPEERCRASPPISPSHLAEVTNILRGGVRYL